MSLFCFWTRTECNHCRIPPSDSHCWLTLGSEWTDKYSFNSVCNSFRRTTQQPQRSPASSHEPSSQEGIAAVLGKLSRAIQPRGDCLGFRTRLRNSTMTTTPTLLPVQNNLQWGRRTIREWWECPTRPPTLCSNSFLKVSDVPAFETK